MKTRQHYLWGWTFLAVIGGVALYSAGVVAGEGESSDGSAIEFTDVRRQTREFIGYNKSINLTPEQEAVKREALEGLPAPCCKDKTAYTCCCSCNMAQSWWGLSKYLIAEHGYGADEVREAVKDWFEFINPNGFTGDACYTRGCGRPFHRNGCGGMSEERVVF